MVKGLLEKSDCNRELKLLSEPRTEASLRAE
jgi:hypothetical protein